MCRAFLCWSPSTPEHCVSNLLGALGAASAAALEQLQGMVLQLAVVQFSISTMVLKGRSRETMLPKAVRIQTAQTSGGACRTAAPDNASSHALGRCGTAKGGYGFLPPAPHHQVGLSPPQGRLQARPWDGRAPQNLDSTMIQYATIAVDTAWAMAALGAGTNNPAALPT